MIAPRARPSSWSRACGRVNRRDVIAIDLDELLDGRSVRREAETQERFIEYAPAHARLECKATLDECVLRKERVVEIKRRRRAESSRSSSRRTKTASS